ncbi:MAG: PIN domain-containing protein [Burkholderiales bacterium]|nr:MAG: PIN domain-containing protein [Burkholderiales bacterium]
MQWVVDASVALAWVFETEGQSQRFAAEIYHAQQAGVLKLHTPAVFHAEIAYRLAKTGRAKKLKSVTILEQAEVIAMAIDFTEHLGNSDCVTLTRFALEHNIQGYDAIYLALALEKRIGVATLDKGLASACRRAGVALYTP